MPDVDVDKLARDSDGCSGAEIKGICAAAAIAAYDRDCEAGHLREGGITMADLEAATRMQKRQITRDMLDGFEQWEKQFRRY
jgi:AAA family ATPase